MVAVIIIIIVWVMITIERAGKTTTVSSCTEETVDDTVVTVSRDNDIVPLATRVESIKIDTKTATEIDDTPIPKQSKGERSCLLAMEKIFRRKARVQVRDIEGLRNPITKQILELDVYIPQENVACEYHGRHHYEYVPFFHRKGPQSLEYQQWKDTFKVDKCDEMGIFLVTVPYTVPDNKIEDFIRNELIKGGVIPYELGY